MFKFLFSWYFPLLTILSIVLLSRNKFYKKVINAVITLPRDLHLTKSFLHFLFLIKYCEYFSYTTVHIFQNLVKKQPQKIAFRCGDRVLTFLEVENLSNQISRYLKEELKVKRGDAIAVYLPNSELYPCFWVALGKIGAIAALINTNQVSKVLQHSIVAAKAKYIIYDTVFTQVLKDLGDDFLKDYELVKIGDGEIVKGSKDLMSGIRNYSKKPLTEEINKGSLFDRYLYIYTSGTTGLPKAAIITHARAIMMALGMKCVGGLRREDVIYDSLPLYHTAGGAVGLGQALLVGSTVVIRPKFSASNFWADCIKYDCTVAQYIGEICRYLLTTPDSPRDRTHSVRLILGNGLRPQIWENFVKRFNIPNVLEFYGSTEGNSNILNSWNRTGSVGYVPWFAGKFYPVNIIKVNEDTLEPIRDPETGLCIVCGVNEPGLCVAKITEKRFNSFNGYVDHEATKKKIIRNVFAKGDYVVNSGDLLVKDELGYIYFKDRTGDTFRWKGENVSTCEVEAIISNIIGLKDATVYGVEIPGVEGRAGMAAILDEKKQLDLNKLEDGLKKELSAYARPLFIRIINSIPMTGTYKIQKNILQNEGFNPTRISDPLYFLKDGKHYVELDETLYKKIVNNEISL